MQNVLIKIGLSKHEIKIYLALLRLGTDTASKIASETGIDRATTYRFLTSLINRGLTNYAIVNNVKYFTASDPNKILLDLKEMQEKFKKVLPKLIAISQIPKEDTKVEVYKGKEGLKAVIQNIVKERKDYTFVGEVEKFFEEMPHYIFHWLKTVEKEKIKGRLICKENAEFKVVKTETYRLISEKFISKISTWTYGNKTAFFIWSKPFFAVVIDNKDVTESTLNVFEYLWRLSKRPSKMHTEKHAIR